MNMHRNCCCSTDPPDPPDTDDAGELFLNAKVIYLSIDKSGSMGCPWACGADEIMKQWVDYFISAMKLKYDAVDESEKPKIGLDLWDSWLVRRDFSGEPGYEDWVDQPALPWPPTYDYGEISDIVNTFYYPSGATNFLPPIGYHNSMRIEDDEPSVVLFFSDGQPMDSGWYPYAVCTCASEGTVFTEEGLVDQWDVQSPCMEVLQWIFEEYDDVVDLDIRVSTAVAEMCAECEWEFLNDVCQTRNPYITIGFTESAEPPLQFLAHFSGGYYFSAGNLEALNELVDSFVYEEQPND